MTDTLNIDLLRKAVNWAKEEHERAEAGKASSARTWDQSTWMVGPVGERIRRDRDGNAYRQVKISCGSACCIAGNACALVGDTFLAEDYHTPGQIIDVDYVMPKGERTAYYISDRAQELLGLTWEEAELLFDGNNDIEDVLEVAGDIARDHGFAL